MAPTRLFFEALFFFGSFFCFCLSFSVTLDASWGMGGCSRSGYCRMVVRFHYNPIATVICAISVKSKISVMSI